MKAYISQLLQGIETTIVNRWRRHPPHFWRQGLFDPWLILPEAISEEEAERLRRGAMETEDILNPEASASIDEMEKWLDGEPGEPTMFSHFGFEPEAFPPADQLSEKELEALVPAICRLWAAFNFSFTIPEKAPARVVYPLLLKRMGEPAMVMKFGCTGIAFCDYEPERCPFGWEYCSCRHY